MAGTKFDKRFYDIIFGEVGGGPIDEVEAVISVFLNRINQEGYEKALKGSAAYTKKSPQYMKAASGDLNPFEKMMYLRNQMLADELLRNPEAVSPYTHFENVNAFGEPSWSKGQPYKDIGRQRFYIIKPNKSRVKAVRK